MGIVIQIGSDNVPTYVSSKMKQYLVHCNIKHLTGIPYNPTGQAIVELSNCTLKEELIKQKGDVRRREI